MPIHLVNVLKNPLKIFIDEKPLVTFKATASVLIEPELKPKFRAKWFAGEGAGSWFKIEENNGNYLVEKFDDALQLESISLMHPVQGDTFFINEPFELKFPVNCSELNIEQNQRKIVLQSKR